MIVEKDLLIEDGLCVVHLDFIIQFHRKRVSIIVQDISF